MKEHKQINKLRKKVNTTTITRGLIEENDHILIGLSGGKDSLVLLDCMASISRKIPFKINLTAIHVDIQNIDYETDIAFLTHICKNLGVRFVNHVVDVEIDEERALKEGPCFICSWQRRKQLFNMARQLECSKIALGHHKDDALETLLMNMMFHASISSLPYSVEMFGGDLQLVRPLLDCTEAELQEYNDLKGFSPENRTCPHDKKTRRNEVKGLLARMNIMYQNAGNNIFHSMGNIYHDYLPNGLDGSMKEKP